MRPICFSDSVHEELYTTASWADVNVEVLTLHEQLAHLSKDAPVRSFVKPLAPDVFQ